jgi:hypothetical protein
MLSPLNRDSNSARKYPDLVRAYDAEIANFNVTMASEAKVVVPLLIGAWLILFFIAFNAERFDPVFRSAGIFLLIASFGYSWSRGYRAKQKEKSVIRGLNFDIANHEEQARSDRKSENA